MQQLLQIFTLIPLTAFIVSLFLPRKNERVISRLAIFSTGIHLAGVVALVVAWLINGHPVLNIKHIVFYQSDNIEIFINFYFDKTTATFAVVGSLLLFLIAVFSRFYLHREEGFKRYFCTLLLFFLGYNLAIFSGNFETLFIGWEILGICSFLLITFYRDRYLPVKNGLKVISIYRFGDVCLILAMWMSHHLWHENITFFKWNDVQLITDHLQEHNWYAGFLAAMIVVAAAAKSAQLPFSSWLPRAMEGPTTSSAIFYGSLSVHLGVFLLLRTYPYWQDILLIKIAVIVLGLCTSIIASGIARVQSTVKTQIAYSSVCQIGLMFVEVALGLHVLALIHFAGNAFLRTYQLLVSPSVLSYLVHDMFFYFKPANTKLGNAFLNRLKNSLYILSVKEWNLDFTMQRLLWNPFKSVGKTLSFVNGKPMLVLLAAILLSGVFFYYHKEAIPELLLTLLPVIFSLSGLLLVLRSFAHRGSAIQAWLFLIAGHLFITLSIAFLNDDFGYSEMVLYLSGTIVSAVAGYFCLAKIRSNENNIDLDHFHGHTYEYAGTGFIFLLACLGFAGLPFTPAFIGIDLLFSHIGKHQEFIILFTAVSFIFIELSLLRIYSRIFLGQHKKAYHPMAFKYS